MDNEGYYDDSSSGGVKSTIVEFLQFLAIVLAIGAIIRFFVAEPHKVSGHSMVPNFQNGDYIITNKVSLQMGSPVRGEVIILHNPRNADEVFIKRVISLPGEKIRLQNGYVFINDQKLDEPYLPAGLKTPTESFLSEGEEFVIPQDNYFVIGDNRGGSSDSREWGPVKKELIIGQAWLRYWPIQKAKLLQINKPSA